MPNPYGLAPVRGIAQLAADPALPAGPLVDVRAVSFANGLALLHLDGCEGATLDGRARGADRDPVSVGPDGQGLAGLPELVRSLTTGSSVGQVYWCDRCAPMIAHPIDPNSGPRVRGGWYYMGYALGAVAILDEGLTALEAAAGTDLRWSGSTDTELGKVHGPRLADAVGVLRLGAVNDQPVSLPVHVAIEHAEVAREALMIRAALDTGPSSALADTGKQLATLMRHCEDRLERLQERCTRLARTFPLGRISGVDEATSEAVEHVVAVHTDVGWGLTRMRSEDERMRVALAVAPVVADVGQVKVLRTPRLAAAWLVHTNLGVAPAPDRSPEALLVAATALEHLLGEGNRLDPDLFARLLDAATRSTS